MALDIISKLNLDMKAPNAEIAYGNQYDSAGHINAQLLNDGEKWFVPSGAIAIVSYMKSDRIGGYYDTTLKGEAAVAFVSSSDRSLITIALDAQTMTTLGNVSMQVNFYQNNQRLSTFAFILNVKASPITAGNIDSKWFGNLLLLSGLVVDNTLSVVGAAADAKTTGDKINDLDSKIDNSIESIANDLDAEISRSISAENRKVNKPDNIPDGTSGQLLRTNGDGTTEWVSVGTPTDVQVGVQVENWLNAHPEATTTVQDNSIVLEKINDSLKGLLINPDTFSGNNDYQKLQAAIDRAIENDYATIVISRKYDITGYELKINKGLYQRPTALRKKLTIIGFDKGEIYKGDSGYVFTGDQVETSSQFACGDFQCINLTVRGAISVGNAKSEYPTWNTRCSVFDCHKLIRLATFGCNFAMVGTVFDGSESNSRTNNMQSIVNFGDLCTYSYAYYKIGSSWVITSYGCTIENCGYGYVSVGSPTITELHIKDCTIEACYIAAIYLEPIDQSIGGMANLEVDGCYFETNGIYESSEQNVTYDIYVHFRFQYNIVITNNHFAPSPYGHCIDLLLRNSAYHIDDNDCTSASTGAYLVFFDTSALAQRVKLYYSNNHVSSIALTNRPDLFVYIGKDTFISYDGIASNSLPSNLDNFTNVGGKSIVNIYTSDQASNLPPNETEGQVITIESITGSLIQLFNGKSSKRMWQRSRFSGVGWTGWAPLSGSVSFEKSGLTSGVPVDLPFTIGVKSMVSVDLIFRSTAVASLHGIGNVVNPGATQFTPYFFNTDGSGQSDRTDIQAVFTITPMYQ